MNLKPKTFNLRTSLLAYASLQYCNNSISTNHKSALKFQLVSYLDSCRRSKFEIQHSSILIFKYISWFCYIILSTEWGRNQKISSELRPEMQTMKLKVGWSQRVFPIISSQNWTKSQSLNFLLHDAKLSDNDFVWEFFLRRRPNSPENLKIKRPNIYQISVPELFNPKQKV